MWTSNFLLTARLSCLHFLMGMLLDYQLYTWLKQIINPQQTKMNKSITQKYSAKVESILSSCYVFKPTDTSKLEYCEAKDVLWDTGATNTIISQNMADALGLQPIKKALIAGIGGNVEASILSA